MHTGLVDRKRPHLPGTAQPHGRRQQRRQPCPFGIRQVALELGERREEFEEHLPRRIRRAIDGGAGRQPDSALQQPVGNVTGEEPRARRLEILPFD